VASRTPRPAGIACLMASQPRLAGRVFRRNFGSSSPRMRGSRSRATAASDTGPPPTRGRRPMGSQVFCFSGAIAVPARIAGRASLHSPSRQRARCKVRVRVVLGVPCLNGGLQHRVEAMRRSAASKRHATSRPLRPQRLRGMSPTEDMPVARRAQSSPALLWHPPGFRVSGVDRCR